MCQAGIQHILHETLKEIYLKYNVTDDNIVDWDCYHIQNSEIEIAPEFPIIIEIQ